MAIFVFILAFSGALFNVFYAFLECASSPIQGPADVATLFGCVSAIVICSLVMLNIATGVWLN